MRNLGQAPYRRPMHIAVLLFAFALCCVCYDRIVCAQGKSTAEIEHNTVVDDSQAPLPPVIMEDYKAVIVSSIESDAALPEKETHKLIDQVVEVLQKNFPKPGAQNESQEKFLGFKERYPKKTSLRTLDINHDPEFLTAEKYKYLSLVHESILVAFLSRIPLSAEELTQIDKSLEQLGARYTDELVKRFPYYAETHGKKDIESIVAKHLGDLRSEITDYTSNRGLLFRRKKIEGLIVAPLPEVKLLYERPREEFRKKVESAEPGSRESFELHLAMMEQADIDRTLNAFTKPLTNPSRGIKDVLDEMSDSYVGISGSWLMSKGQAAGDAYEQLRQKDKAARAMKPE